MSSSMTRQHFKAVARFISYIEDRRQRKQTCSDAIQELRGFNSNFNRQRFEEACGVHDDEEEAESGSVGMA